MKIGVLFLNVVACTWAQSPLDLGPFDVDVQIGTCKPRYRPTSDADKIASKNAVEWILALLPSYDPYEVDSIGPFTFDSILARGKAAASNVVVKGLNGLEIDNLDMRMYYDLQQSPYRLDVDIRLPVVDVDADIDATMDILFLPTDISGRVKMKLLGVEAKGSLCADPKRIRGNEVFQHTALKARAHVDNVQVTLDLVQYAGLDRDLLLAAANSLKDMIAQEVANIVLQKTNEILSQIPREEAEKILANPMLSF